jgi:hypothetical protein
VSIVHSAEIENLWGSTYIMMIITSVGGGSSSSSSSTGRAMVQAVGRRPRIADTHVRSQASSCEICDGQRWHSDRFFFLLGEFAKLRKKSDY